MATHGQASYGPTFPIARDEKRLIFLGKLDYSSAKHEIELAVLRHMEGGYFVFHWDRPKQKDLDHPGWCFVEVVSFNMVDYTISMLTRLRINSTSVHVAHAYSNVCLYMATGTVDITDNQYSIPTGIIPHTTLKCWAILMLMALLPVPLLLPR